MTGGEEKQGKPIEIGMNNSFQPFLELRENEQGDFESAIWKLSNIGEAKFYASSDLRDVDDPEKAGILETKTFLEDPRRVWAEITPREKSEHEVEKLRSTLELYFDLIPNNSVLLIPRIENGKLIFDLATQVKTDKRVLQKEIKNPLLEDKKFIETSVFTFMRAI